MRCTVLMPAPSPRAATPATADFVAIDLDPMPGVPFTQVRDVARGASIVRQASLLRLEVGVKRGQGDYAKAKYPAVGCDRNDGLPGGLVVKADLLPNERNLPALAIQPGTSRNDFEYDHGIGLAADKGDGVVDAPAKDVRYRTIFALGDADDSIADLQLSRERCRAAGNELANGCALFLFDQYCPDADQREQS